MRFRKKRRRDRKISQGILQPLPIKMSNTLKGALNGVFDDNNVANFFSDRPHKDLLFIGTVCHLELGLWKM